MRTTQGLRIPVLPMEKESSVPERSARRAEEMNPARGISEEMTRAEMFLMDRNMTSARGARVETSLIRIPEARILAEMTSAGMNSKAGTIFPAAWNLSMRSPVETASTAERTGMRTLPKRPSLRTRSPLSSFMRSPMRNPMRKLTRSRFRSLMRNPLRRKRPWRTGH